MLVRYERAGSPRRLDLSRALSWQPRGVPHLTVERRSSRHDFAVPALVALWVPLVLGLDVGATVGRQRLLGLGTWALLLAVLAGESRATRVQVGVVVAFATFVEYVFAGWLGVYVYRLHNVPSFVPPGHGLVYLAALCLGRSAWAHRHAPAFLHTTIVCCGVWVVWGLTLAPRPDVLGAFWFGCLLVFARRGRSPLLYASAFVVVSYLELLGTGLGTWAWQPTDPTGLIGIGNPPSGIAGGYAWFDAAALALSPRLLRLSARWSRAARSAAPRQLGGDGRDGVPERGRPLEVQILGGPRHPGLEPLPLPDELGDRTLGELHG